MTGPGSPGEQRAQARFGTSVRAAAFYEHQVLAYLNRPMREFIARRCRAVRSLRVTRVSSAAIRSTRASVSIARLEMVYIATADARGNCDCSFRAGAPGFVQVLDDRTLAYPEYRGNGVLASVGNMLENPRIGMVFLDYFQTTVGLHVNGSARVLDPQDMAAVPQLTLDPHDAGPTPKAWILIQVEEAYIHCSKHVPLLAKREKHIVWGTDDERLKGGNFFKSTP